jgi:hypothetical protein
MKWKAGAGVTKVQVETLLMLVQAAPNAQAASAQVTWLLPDGVWWKLKQVRTNLDATNATLPVDVNVVATKTGIPSFKIGLATPLAALTFDGQVTFADQMPAQQSNPVGTVTAPLPDVWLPPGTSIQLNAVTAAGFAVLQQCVLTAEGAELVADL